MSSPPPALGAIRWTPALAAVAVVVYAIANDSSISPFLGLLAVGFVIGAAAFAVGGLVGFLFGLPRTLDPTITGADSSTPGREYMLTNTNLEEISDWLTKILVGIGLVQLGAFISRMSALGDSLAPGLGGSDGAEAFAVGLVVYCLIDGFVLGYLWTRIVVSMRLRATQRLLQATTELELQDARVAHAAAEVLASPLPPPPPVPPPAPPASVPSEAPAERPSVPGPGDEDAG